MNYLTSLQEHLRLFCRLRNGTKISDAKFVRLYLEIFPGGGSYENPTENKVGGICFRSPTVSRAFHEQLSLFEIRMYQESPNVQNNTWLPSFELGSNPARTRTLCATRPGPRAGSGRGPRVGPGPLQTSSAVRCNMAPNSLFSKQIRYACAFEVSSVRETKHVF
jgi:hypothetical protein